MRKRGKITRKRFKILFVLGFLLATLPGIITAQSWEQLGSSYYAYDYCEFAKGRTEGLTPFYISHYGRHGSRWLTDDARYAAILAPFDTLELTTLGAETHQKLKKLADNGIGRAGQLTSLGERQHHDIAQRMIRMYPEVFGDSALIRAKSSTAMRCAMSMAAFCEGLKEVNPTLQIMRQPYPKLMQQMAYDSPEAKAFKDSLEHSQGYMEFVAKTVDPNRIMKSLFLNPEKMTLEQQIKWLIELYWGVQSIQNVGMQDLGLYSLFTYEEMQALWSTINARMYMCHSDSPVAAGRTIHCADSLLLGIIDDADRAIEAARCSETKTAAHGARCSEREEGLKAAAHGARCSEGVAADLRFGHDTHLLRLMALMQIIPTPQIEQYEDVAAQWRDYELSPMAANLQLIFYRDSDGKVYVQGRLNEREIMSPQPWEGLRTQWLNRIDK